MQILQQIAKTKQKKQLWQIFTATKGHDFREDRNVCGSLA